MNVLYLIVARGGSKGVPGKNMRKIGGHSLLGYKAISARKSHYCLRLILSSDDAEIQSEAKRYGVEVPFVRPVELATDSAATEDVMLHAMQYINQHDDITYDAVMLLEPSSPFGRACDYDAAVELMEKKRANLVVGMRETTVNSVFVGPMDFEGRISSIVEKIKNRKALARQDFAQEYTMNGAFYLVRWDWFLRTQKRYCDSDNSYGVFMPWQYSVEIDEERDLAWAEYLIEKEYVDKSFWEH